MSVLWSLAEYTTLAQSQPAVMHFTEHEEQPQNRFIDEPRINPSPRKILVLQGHKDRGIEIWFDSAYSTTNEECRSQSLGNRILGAPNVPQAVIDSMRVPAEQTEFSVRFFLDRYLPGRCDWQPIGVGHAEFEPNVSRGPKGNSGVVAIRPEGKHRTELAWVCHHATSYYSKGEEPWLACQTMGRFSIEQTTMSTDGGLVEIKFTLAPDQGSPRPKSEGER
ncbi:hypothetical protein ACPUET_15280 [Paraburkholderia graminis]|uniref:hypothetical protein n=1 Tax=Paraburkholderia graminis TaxID=60548 RepID=UPI003C9A4A45